MKQEQELREKVVKLLMVKEVYKRQMMKQEQELQEKAVELLMAVEEEQIERILRKDIIN
jgi:hypothetical protein